MTKLELPDLLVNVDWLHQHLDHADLVLFDASWHMPASGRDGAAEWRQRRIPGARFFDFDGKIRDPAADLPHMMPSPQKFTRELQALGLNRTSKVVVYDASGMFSSPRVWWMLRAMGCRNCALLDGGLPAWDKAGYPVEHQPPADCRMGDFVAHADAQAFVDAQSVQLALDDDGSCVLDARPRERFSGQQQEPRAGLRRGHMPGALNLPFAELFNDGLLKSKAELRQILMPLIGNSTRGICSCGSGVTACIIAFAAQYIGYDNVAVYDGSWCDWGRPGTLPVVCD